MIVGPQRLYQDLAELGFDTLSIQRGNDNMDYVIISEFEIPAGSHAGRLISLAIPAPPDYPRGIAASIHVKADPILFPKQNISNVRNIIDSTLGESWQYWSYRFHTRPENTTNELISQINDVFRRN